MQLKSIKISNLLSFKYVDPSDSFKGVTFFTSSSGITNILIGPNGSGKSNFLEICNQVFKSGLFKNVEYNAEPILDAKKTLIERPIQVMPLRKHAHFEDKPSHVELVLELHQNDRDNVHFVCKFREQLNALIAKYSQIQLQFPEIHYDAVGALLELPIQLQVDDATGKMRILRDGHSPIVLFWYDYIENFELIQKCIELYNELERNQQERERYPLKNTFAILGPSRHLDELNPTLKKDVNLRQQFNEKAEEESFKSQRGWPVGFEFLKQKLVSSYSLAKGTFTYYSVEEIQKSELFARCNAFTQRYLGYEFVVSYDQQVGSYHFAFLDQEKKSFELDELSSGEKSMLMMLATIFGYDLEHGCMMIDEPELHLHPQLQKEFMRLLGVISHELGMQFIIATHSPLMVNEYNINNVYRFYRKHSFTHIVSPQRYYVDNEANLIQMLKFTNSSKIFFVDSILLCEGETDEYFFNFYLSRLKKKSPERDQRISNYEIININGKGSYKMRSKFLAKFGLKCYFIGDRDNIKEELTDVDFDHIRMQCRRIDTRFHHHGKTEKYARLVTCIADHFPDLHQLIHATIQKLYAQNVYILKQGDIEAYLGLHMKGLDETIEFCHRDFDRWLKNPEFQGRREEFEQIFQKIFASS